MKILNIGNCDKILRYSYETTKFLKKNIINYNNKNLINSFSLSIPDTANSYINNLNYFRKILKKLLNSIKIPYVNIGIGNSLKSNSLVHYQRTKKNMPLVLEDVINHNNNFLEVSKTLRSKTNTIIDTIKSYDISSQRETVRRGSNIYFTSIVKNKFLSLNLELPNLHKNLKDKFQNPFIALNNDILSGYVSRVSNFTFPKNRTMRSPSLLSTTFSSLHSLLEPSSTTFSSLHSLLEPSSYKTPFSKVDFDTFNNKILDKIISNKKNISYAVSAIAANTGDLSSFFNDKLQDKSHSFNIYFKGPEKVLNSTDALKKNLYLFSSSFKNLNYDNLNIKKYNNVSKNLLQDVNSSNNLIKIHNDSKISKSLDEIKNTTSNFLKIELKKDIKKFVANSPKFFHSNGSLLSPIQNSSVLLPENNGLTKRGKLLPALPSTILQDQVKNPRYHKNEHKEEIFKVANINDIKIKHTTDLENLMYETKNIDDVYSANNIVENIDKNTNHKLNSLKIDIETILSTELKKHAIQNNISSTTNIHNMNDMQNTDKYSNYKRSNEYTINDLKKDLEDLLITELRKHGVV